MSTNYYAILELDQDATAEDVRRSYRRLALRYHPDKAGPEGAARFKEIAAAYAVLSDPSKRAMYDRCGTAGLDAMDNPVAARMGNEFGMGRVMGATVLILTLQLVMIILFLALLAAFVDGHMTSATYVKVFAPLFVVDVFVVLLLPFLPCVVVVRAGGGVILGIFVLFMLCLAILTIVVPIAKDRNEKRRATGRDDWLLWRVWLIPAYVLMACFATIKLISLAGLRQGRAELRAAGMRLSARFIFVSAALHIVQVACAAVLTALVACRADNVITISYFVVIGLPFYVYAACDIADSFFTHLFIAFVCQPEEGNDNETHEAAGDDNAGAAAAADDSHRTATSKRQAQDEGTPAPRPGRPVFVRAYLNIIVTSATLHILIWGLVLAFVTMLSVRLDHYAHYGSYVGVLSLAKALIPLYIIVGLGIVFSIFIAVQMCSLLDTNVTEADGDEGDAESNNSRRRSDATVHDESQAHISERPIAERQGATGDNILHPRDSDEADRVPTAESSEESVAVLENLSNVD